jgi:hypothetical protein
MDRYSIKSSIFIILKSCNFQDEKIILSCPSGRVWVYRPKGTRYNPKYFNRNSHSGQFSIKLHGYVSGQGGLGVLTRIRGNLNSDKYREVLREIFPVIIDEFPDDDFIFMHDRHPAHTSARTREFLQEKYPEIVERMLDWRPKGADLNPIENIWSLLVHGVSQLSRLF